MPKGTLIVQKMYENSQKPQYKNISSLSWNYFVLIKLSLLLFPATSPALPTPWPTSHIFLSLITILTQYALIV